MTDRAARPSSRTLTRAQRAITDLMDDLDRADPLHEAQFAALETVLSLLRADSTHTGRSGNAIRLLREALGSARATVVATGYALTRTDDLRRARKEAS